MIVKKGLEAPATDLRDDIVVHIYHTERIDCLFRVARRIRNLQFGGLHHAYLE